MVQGNYEKLLEKIANSAGIGKEEIEEKIEAKRARLAGLISREGAAQVIAAELGISFDNEKLKINELIVGMRKVNLVGKVTKIFPVKTFNKNNREGKVANMIIADETANVKVVLWDLHHIELIENNAVAEGKVIEIINGSVRENEVHLGSFSELKASSELLEDVKTAKTFEEKNLINSCVGDNLNARAFIVQVFEPKFFNVCSECKKKVNFEEGNFVCAEHGKINPEKRALMNLILDDGTEAIRAVLFHGALQKVGITEFENLEMLSNQRQDLLGKEMIFFGNIRNNKFFNSSEFIVENVQDADVNQLISILEKF
jgi:hypothetical protein